ncbi:MAG TPA: threonine ammonia-lyase [Capsulimonadaceae bacterium]|nr:threonine ammonia-lyase [Capsulimonadaceae bacterium]
MITLADIQRAQKLVSQIARRTPVMTSPTISALCHADLTAPDDGIFLKAENLQKTGSFKIRGAYWRLSLLSASEKESGVVAASAGNHAQGLALAAKLLGVSATVYMPETASIAKIQATKGYGATVVLEGRTFDEAVIAAKNFQKRTGAVFVSAYDDDAIIAGQGTLGLEIIEDLPDVDSVIIPVGGGGLFSGVATAIKSLKPDVRIVGVQAEGADNAYQSFIKHKLLLRTEPVHTICDGIAIKSPSARTFEYIETYADDMVTVADTDISSALLLLIERMKLVVEPAGAAGLAALLAGRTEPHGKTLVILSGGNLDMKLLADLIGREMIKEHRYLHLFTEVTDKPGGLARLLDIVASEKGNIITVNHNRISPHVPLGATGVELLLEVRDEAHQQKLTGALQAHGYSVEMME